MRALSGWERRWAGGGISNPHIHILLADGGFLPEGIANIEGILQSTVRGFGQAALDDLGQLSWHLWVELAHHRGRRIPAAHFSDGSHGLARSTMER